MPTTGADRLQVAVGVLSDHSGRVLIQQRVNNPKAGKWEFPGGKLDRQETKLDALKRELKEELGVAVIHAEPLTEVKHDYSHGKVALHVFLVKNYFGEPVPRERQPIRWVSISEFEEIDFLEGNEEILKAITRKSPG